jgi:hypothetical protein
MAVGSCQPGHVVVILAHRDLARFQRLLELRSSRYQSFTLGFSSAILSIT